MVGEIRDMETANIGIHASLTGHLLFSTLHTNDAPGAITRLMDMGVENYLVASTLICVMAQRLVRRICQHCKVKQDVSEDILKRFDSSVKEVWGGSGCEYCSGTGYRGRIGIFEVLPIGNEIRDLIMRRATVERDQRQGNRPGDENTQAGRHRKSEKRTHHYRRGPSCYPGGSVIIVKVKSEG